MEASTPTIAPPSDVATEDTGASDALQPELRVHKDGVSEEPASAEVPGQDTAALKVDFFTGTGIGDPGVARH